MNNLSIYIDIDQEFDKVLETIAIAGMAGKLKRQTVQRATLTAIQEKAWSEYNDNFFAYETAETSLNNLISITKEQSVNSSNFQMRDAQGRFTSKRTELQPNKLAKFLNEQNYSVLNHVRNRLTPQARETFDADFNHFLFLHTTAKKLVDDVIVKSKNVASSNVTYTKANDALKEINKDIKTTTGKLRKLGYVAIMKILKDIEKKAERA